MSTANTLATLDGLFKEVYSDKIEKAVPHNNKLQEIIKFASKDRQLGAGYNQPIVLGLEHGMTYAAEDDGAFDLNNAVAGQMKNARVKAYQMVLRSSISYHAASRAITSKNAFQDATRLLIGNMVDSFRKKLEIDLFYGQSGLAKIKTAVTVTTAGNDVEILESSWAPGIWGGAEKMKVDVYTGSTYKGTLEVVSVSFENKSVKLKIATGTLNVLVGDDLFPEGAYNKQMAGLHKIMSNTGSLFEIDAAEYGLWKGTVYDPGAPSVLTFPIIQQAIAKGVEKGLDKDVSVLVNPSHWDDLLTDEAALRMYDSSYKTDKAERGSKSIRFYSQNGAVEIIPSIYVKEGHAFVICPDDFMRIGSTDVTFKRPGYEGNFFTELGNNAGYEIRALSDSALFCVKPGRQVLITNLKAS